jgi:choice-of-anchor C domain-containing protein
MKCHFIFSRNFLSLVFAMAVCMPAFGQSLIVNGSFEASSPLGPQLNFPGGSTDITGWTVIGGNVDYMDSASANPGLVWQAAEGTRSLDLAGSPGMGGMAQSFETIAGGQYHVSFAMAGNYSGSPAIKTMEVRAAGQSATFTFDTTDKNAANMGWEYHTWTFTATGSSTTLELLNATSESGGIYYGPVLDDVSVDYVHDGTIWGVKSHDPVSNPPSTLFKFSPSGGIISVATVTLNSANIDVDGLAMDNAGQLYAFIVNSSGTASQLIRIDRDTAAATVIGPVLTGRDIRGAAFDHLGRLLAIDAAQDQLLQIDPASGQVQRILFGFPAMSNCCDITQQRDGTFMIADVATFHRLTILRGSGVYYEFYNETQAGQEGDSINMAGLAVTESGADPDLLYLYDVGEQDDIYTYQYTYDPANKLTRQTLAANLISDFNAGRGDLASVPSSLLPFYAMNQWTIAQGGNGHWYQTVRVLGGIDWYEAQAVAVSRGGHLATIHSDAENSFCYDLINDDPDLWYIDGWGSGIGPWIGGYELGEGTWLWITGEPWTFSRWASGEPNNLGGSEAFTHFFSNLGTLMNSTWNDIGAYIQIHGYIVEWSPAAGPYNMNHLAQVSNSWATGQTDLKFNPAWDLTGDGQINLSDLMNFAQNWLE